MDEQKIIQKLTESIFAAKSSISAVEKWSHLLAEKFNVETDKIQEKVQEMKDVSEIADVVTDEKVVEGIFDGKNMIAPDGTQYPVPANYASKSKLVFGDKLKLTIQANGAFVYKQIELVPRKLLTGHLILDGSQYKVLAEGKEYNVIYASVTFFRANVGDEITIIVPDGESTSWAAIENVLPKNSTADV